MTVADCLKRPSPRLRNATGFTSASASRTATYAPGVLACAGLSDDLEALSARSIASTPTYRRKFAHAAVSLLPKTCATRAAARRRCARAATSEVRPRYETSVSAHSRGPHFWVSSDLAKTPRQLPRRRRPGVNFKFKFQVELVKFRFTSRSCASPVARSRGSPAARGHFPLVPSPRISY